MAQKFTNKALTKLAANISAVDVTLTVSAGTGAKYPIIDGAANPNNDYFVITLEDAAGNYELVKVVHHLAGDTFGSVTYPCVRAYWDTTTHPAAAWTGTTTSVDLRPLAQTMEAFNTGMFGTNNLSELANKATARSTLGISAANTPFTPTGAIVGTDTQTAVAGVDSALTAHTTASSAHSAVNVDYGGSPHVPAGTVDGALTILGNTKQQLASQLTALAAMPTARASQLGSVYGVTTVADNTDISTLTTAGSYAFNASASANIPLYQVIGRVIVDVRNNGLGEIEQTFISLSNSTSSQYTWRRVYRGSAWLPWNIVAHGTMVGTVITSALGAVPYGYLECDGSVLPTASYNDLYNYVLTTYNTGGEGAGNFRIPDFRGEFLRGWDHGRGVDSGRNLGVAAAQASQMSSHTHAMADGFAPGTMHHNSTSSGFYNTTTTDGVISSSIANAGGTSNSSETRPRNLAVMYCIKY